MWEILKLSLTFTYFFSYSISISNELCVDESQVVRFTEYGLISGSVVTSQFNNSTKFFAFRPVPYAHPPVGKLRFQAPQPAKRWFGIKDATSKMVMCAQKSNSSNGNDVVGSEDCLYLEIFEALTAKEKEPQCELLPVMVWFHGGAFIFANPSETEPDFLMEKPVVFVGVQYRLSVFGFLSTEDSYAEGNNGLKDQLFALKWVKRNIRYFGGDPNSVTIFGESAGGASVLYHMVSPQSQGYFHKAISQSGSSLNRWAYRSKPREMAYKLGKGLGILTNSNKKLIESLQQVDYKTLLFAAFNPSIVGFYLPFYAAPFAPSLERESPSAFITEKSYEALQKGSYNKVPYMLGHNTEEGSFAYIYVDNGRVNLSLYEQNPELLLPISMNLRSGSMCARKVLSDIENFYFKDGNFTDSRYWIPYMSQDLFVRGISKTIDLTYKMLPEYFYKFSYIGQYHVGFIGGVGHYGEMHYLFYRTGMIHTPISTPKDLEVSKRMVTLWTNFARTGNPTPEKDKLLQNIIWPKVNASKPCLSIDNDLSIIYDPDKVDDEFWEKEFVTCGNQPYSTY